MLFPQKTKGFFVELNDHAILMARTSAAAAPLVVEELAECPVNDPAALASLIQQLQPRKSPSGYINASVGIYPAKRVIRRHTLDPKRLKEPDYISEICTQQLHIDPDKYVVAMLNASDGADSDGAKAPPKDVLFCGMMSEEASAAQTALLAAGIYPERLELGTVATLGGVADWLAHSKAKTPTLVLEMGTDSIQSFIVTANGVGASRLITQGLGAMVPIVQKELGLKDEESARKLFYSNTFDFTGMGPLLIKKLLKELQSSIGFYEVQTGQSVARVVTTQLPPKLQWLDGAIAGAMGLSNLTLDPLPWLRSRGITVPDTLAKPAQDVRWFGLLALMAQYDAAHVLPAEEKK